VYAGCETGVKAVLIRPSGIHKSSVVRSHHPVLESQFCDAERHLSSVFTGKTSKGEAHVENSRTT